MSRMAPSGQTAHGTAAAAPQWAWTGPAARSRQGMCELGARIDGVAAQVASLTTSASAPCPNSAIRSSSAGWMRLKGGPMWHRPGSMPMSTCRWPCRPSRRWFRRSQWRRRQRRHSLLTRHCGLSPMELLEGASSQSTSWLAFVPSSVSFTASAPHTLAVGLISVASSASVE